MLPIYHLKESKPPEWLGEPFSTLLLQLQAKVILPVPVLDGNASATNSWGVHPSVTATPLTCRTISCLRGKMMPLLLWCDLPFDTCTTSCNDTHRCLVICESSRGHGKAWIRFDSRLRGC